MLKSTGSYFARTNRKNKKKYRNYILYIIFIFKVEKHEEICVKTSQKKRKAFDMTKARVKVICQIQNAENTNTNKHAIQIQKKQIHK